MVGEEVGGEIGMEGKCREVRGKERSKLESFELDPTIRTEVMVKMIFKS